MKPSISRQFVILMLAVAASGCSSAARDVLDSRYFVNASVDEQTHKDDVQYCFENREIEFDAGDGAAVGATFVLAGPFAALVAVDQISEGKAIGLSNCLMERGYEPILLPTKLAHLPTLFDDDDTINDSISQFYASNTAAERADWAKAVESGEANGYKSFIAKYPDSIFVAEAEDRVFTLAADGFEPAPASTGVGATVAANSTDNASEASSPGVFTLSKHTGEVGIVFRGKETTGSSIRTQLCTQSDPIFVNVRLEQGIGEFVTTDNAGNRILGTIAPDAGKAKIKMAYELRSPTGVEFEFRIPNDRATQQSTFYNIPRAYWLCAATIQFRPLN